MERSCSWAKLQIISADACILNFPTARFSGILFTWVQTDSLSPLFGLASRTVEPLGHQLSKIQFFHRAGNKSIFQLKRYFTSSYVLRKNCPLKSFISAGNLLEASSIANGFLRKADESS
jgi:hypothetical protein